MKKLLIAIIAVMAFVMPASAQKVGIYATYGAYTSNDAIGAYHNDYGKLKVGTSWGTVNAGIDFSVGKFRIGPSYSFSSASTKVGNYGVYYHTILLNGKYDYFRMGIVSLYAHLGLGAEITHYEDYKNSGHFAFHVSPIGARFNFGGGFNGIAELGFGAQGVIQLGFGYDF